MASARYQLPQHPTLGGPHTKEELYVLVERGSLGRGEIVTDRISGRSHKIGELIGGMRPPRTQENSVRIERPAYQEFSGDTPWEMEGEAQAPQDNDEEAELEEDEGEEDYIIDSSTGVDEDTLCYHGHPSWLSFTKPLLLCLVLVGGATAAMPLGGKYFVIGLALASFTLCCTIIARQHRDYYVSGERVEVEWGIIGRNSKEVRIVDIRSMDVHQKGLLGFLGVGTLDFSSSGTDGVEVQFKNVRRAHKVKELVRQLQRRAESGGDDRD
jgi:hypothetical protein